jgi:hypothetical protein
LRGPYQPNQYGDVILPFTILRRLDCILEPTKDQVLAEYKKVQSQKIDPGVVLKSTFKLPRWWWWCSPPHQPKRDVRRWPRRSAWRWRRWLWSHRNYE